MSKILSLIPAAAMAAYGASLLFRTRDQLEEVQVLHQRRLADRLARGSDAYAEELRSIEAYKPIASLRQRRLLGAMLLIVSIAYICLFIFN